MRADGIRRRIQVNNIKILTTTYTDICFCGNRPRIIPYCFKMELRMNSAKTQEPFIIISVIPKKPKVAPRERERRNKI